MFLTFLAVKKVIKILTSEESIRDLDLDLKSISDWVRVLNEYKDNQHQI